MFLDSSLNPSRAIPRLAGTVCMSRRNVESPSQSTCLYKHTTTWQEAPAHSKHASRLNPTCHLQVQPLKETTHGLNKATELCPTGCVPVTRNQVLFEHFCLAFQCCFQSVLLLQLLKKEILQLRWTGADGTVQTRAPGNHSPAFVAFGAAVKRLSLTNNNEITEV